MLYDRSGFHEVPECADLTINSNIPLTDSQHAANKPESRAAFHNPDVTVVFGDVKPPLANTRSQQQLMDDTKTNLMFAALEGYIQ
jgi:hypothetical protein